MYKFVVVSLLSVIPTISTAGSWTDGQQEVKDIIWKSGRSGFSVDASLFHDPEKCQWTSKENVYLISPTLENEMPNAADRLFTMMLDAQTNEKKLTVFVDGCVDQQPRITGLKLSK